MTILDNRMPVKSALALDAKNSIRDLTGGSHSSLECFEEEGNYGQSVNPTVTADAEI
jgi:hypothetical protein